MSTHGITMKVDEINTFQGGSILNENTVKKIREFNRYYTVWLNVMNKGYLETDFSWPESRVLFEIYIYCGISATELCEAMALIEKILRENYKKNA